ncbi:MAG: hypothetical protein ACRDYE_00980 [Acidimicrobiales bacterium]
MLPLQLGILFALLDPLGQRLQAQGREAAAAITGITLVTDAGYMSSGITSSFPAATAIANLLLNR